MFKKALFRKQQLKFMFFNLIAFTVIFTIFGIIIIGQVQRTLFSKSDEELLSFKEMMTEHPSRGFESPLPDDKMDRLPPREERQREHPNPRIIVLKWNKNGEIINQNEIGSSFYESFIKGAQLDKTNLNIITNTTINNLYHFRYLLFETADSEGEIIYTQLLINTDAEQTIIDNFEWLIIVCSIIFIILSISASYILSRKMMKPIIHSWNKQAEFVENASHELRTPLTIIQNKLELLLTEPHEKIMNKFENIALSLSETRRLSKLTSDLLTLARADSAETQLTKQILDVDSFIQKVCAPYIEIAESQDKHFWLNLNCKVSIEADEVRLHQLLVILLDNALKYTSDDDSIGVKTYVEDHKVVLEVSDTGIGIKEENMKYIFDRFYREDKARSRETGGMGLGLSIAQWIAAKHNGTITVFQNNHKGTTFKVKLPK
ncbi:HAMP domain-containing sensor histidine kinase [Cytobacillus praedii]|uniref:sensor histidine kinase n=1 Tax=Cytobacillus praedii TaxID=1742358 RepID=UPI002E225EE6|nr:HAMP domain-containing sensor histidine kinase [Cytobacillus praedii]